jgi:selenium-binding protein 1
MNCVVSVKDLSSSIWLWYRDGERWAIRKVIEIPAEPADAAQLPPMLQGFKAVPPLCTDINLSLDDRFLYVSCWGTGDLHQYDVSDPHSPKLTGTIRLGGIVSRAAHPRSGPLTGAPQMVEVSRDGSRIYFTSSLYAAWDEQFYPEPRPVTGWMAKVTTSPQGGGLTLDPSFFVEFGQRRSHQIRLAGGDASSDSFCFP